MRPRSKPIKVFVTEHEREAITRKAQSANLSLSAYLRAAGLNHPVRSMMDIYTIQGLTRIHRELGRYAEAKGISELRELQTMVHQIMGKGVRK